jgi:chromate transport protein ChrA
MDTADDTRSRGGRWAGRALYWLAVTAVSLVVVWLLLGLLNSFDGSTVGIVTLG